MVNADVVLIRIEAARTVANVVGYAQPVGRAVVRQWVERQNRFRNRADPVVRNAVAREGKAGQRILHDHVLGAEIAVAHGLGRHGVLNRLAARKPEALERAEEEGLVAPFVKPRNAHRAAAARAEVVAYLLRFGQRAEGFRIESAVLMKPERGRVVFARAAL